MKMLKLVLVLGIVGVLGNPALASDNGLPPIKYTITLLK